MTVLAAANLGAASARLLAIRASVVAWAVRDRIRSGGIRTVARRTYLDYRALSRRSTRLVEVARERQRLAAWA